jgi:hypothetical protein
MRKPILVFFNLISALVGTVLITMITAKAEVIWANSSHSQMWAELADGLGGE